MELFELSASRAHALTTVTTALCLASAPRLCPLREFSTALDLLHLLVLSTRLTRAKVRPPAWLAPKAKTGSLPRREVCNCIQNFFLINQKALE